MELTLPKSQKKAVVKDWLTHKAVSAYNAELFRGVQIDNNAVSVSKAHLIEEFGAEEVSKLDELPEGEYEKEFNRLKEQYMQRKIEMKGLELGNIERANTARLVVMVDQIDGKPASEAVLDELPQKDFEALQEQVEKIASEDEEKGSGNLDKPSEG